jgi:hypothetical protein
MTYENALELMLTVSLLCNVVVIIIWGFSSLPKINLRHYRRYGYIPDKLNHNNERPITQPPKGPSGVPNRFRADRSPELEASSPPAKPAALPIDKKSCVCCFGLGRVQHGKCLFGCNACRGTGRL